MGGRSRKMRSTIRWSYLLHLGPTLKSKWDRIFMFENKVVPTGPTRSHFFSYAVWGGMDPVGTYTLYMGRKEDGGPSGTSGDKIDIKSFFLSLPWRTGGT